MQLRERQREFVDNCVKALLKHGNTLGVAPTGAGKTIMLSAVVGEFAKLKPNFKACVLAHRKELTEQNVEKFSKVNPDITTSIFNAEIKSWEGQTTFAMVQTLSNKKPLKTIPHIDLLVVDEAHHVTARSYKKIIAAVKGVNPKVLLFGVTATPQRGDKSSLGKIFNNCADQIFLCELIDSGHLVEPKTFIVDVAYEKLAALELKNNGDYSESEVAEILDQPTIADEVIKNWKRYAGGRKTVVFCSTIEHARHVAIVFESYGVNADLITSELTKELRELALYKLASGEIQVLVNVAILTEGWDFPPVSCVILLRQSSYKSTMIQMIGRGLRVIDKAIYPNESKEDCIVLDFGVSSAMHKSIEQEVKLEREVCTKSVGEAPIKICQACDATIPARSNPCPVCGYKAERKIIEDAREVDMQQIYMLDSDEVQWVETDIDTIFSSGLTGCWAWIAKKDDEWVIVVSKEGDDYLNSSEDFNKAYKLANCFIKKNEGLHRIKKTIDLKREPATDKQLKYLPKNYKDVSKGEAMMLLAFEFKAKPRLQELGLIT